MPVIIFHPFLFDVQPAEVGEFKYLGSFFDCTLGFIANTEYIFKKAI